MKHESFSRTAVAAVKPTREACERNHRPYRAAFKVGPLTVLARAARPVALRRSAGVSAPADAALADFEAEPQARPDCIVEVLDEPPAPRPAGAILYRHRAGWDLYADGECFEAVKAIPYGSDTVLRSLRFDPRDGQARLRTAPGDPLAGLPFAYTLSELLILLLSRQSGALLVHAACVETDGGVLLLPGPSGSGKSTLAALWNGCRPGSVLGDESHLLAADTAGRLLVSGSPWPGSSGLYANRTRPLQAVCFLEHGIENALAPLAPAEGLAELLSQAFLPAWDAQALDAVSRTAAHAAQAVPLARLAFLPDLSAVQFLSARGPHAPGNGPP